MSHEHEAVYLAVASLDFELSPDERRRMETGLAECPECAAIAASHGDLASLLDRLPVHDASPQVRQRIMRAALVPPRQSQWTVLLVAAAILGLLLAAAVGVGAFRERPPLEAAVVDPSATPPRTVTRSPAAPSSSPAPDPAGRRGDRRPFRPGTPFSADTLAEVVSPRLRIRSEPRVAADSISTSHSWMSATACSSSMVRSWRMTTSGTRSSHGGRTTSTQRGRPAGSRGPITTGVRGCGGARRRVRAGP